MSAKLGSKTEPNSEEQTPQKLTLKKDAMLQALTTSLGNVTEAAAAVGMSRETHYDWLKNDAEYAAAVASLKNVALDFAESQLKKLMEGAERQALTHDGDVVTIKDAPNTSAVIFYLKTQGKQRGYIERQELSTEIKSINITIDGTNI
jgi:hypothetical protein